MTATLVVGGCQTQQTRYVDTSISKGEYYTDAESLLNGEGYLSLVEEDKDISPIEQHMKARVQVDPDQVKGHRDYTRLASAPDEKTHFRTLRLASAEMVTPEKKPEKKQASFIIAKPKFITPNLKLKTISTRKAGQEEFAKTTSSADVADLSVVKNIRMGEHSGKTRFVLDMTGPSEFSYEINNEKNYVLIDLPGTGWEASTKQLLQSHPLVKGYSVRSNSEGTKILVALKKPGKLVSSESLPPDSKQGHRLYFDIQNAG